MKQYKISISIFLAGVLALVFLARIAIASDSATGLRQNELLDLIETANSTKKGYHKLNEIEKRRLHKIKRILSVPMNGKTYIDIEAKNDKGETALVIAVKRNNAAITQLLLDRGADANARNIDGTPILLTSTRYQCGKLVLSLIKARPYADIRDAKGRTPLTNLVANDCQEHVDLLLQNGADVNFPRTLGLVNADAALHIARDYVVLNLLGEHGADINQREAINGFTPLHYGVLRNDFLKVEYLMGQGADPTIKDHSGKTPLDYALTYGGYKTHCEANSCWFELYTRYNEDRPHRYRNQKYETFTNDRIIELLQGKGD